MAEAPCSERGQCGFDSRLRHHAGVAQWQRQRFQTPDSAGSSPAPSTITASNKASPLSPTPKSRAPSLGASPSTRKSRGNQVRLSPAILYKRTFISPCRRRAPRPPYTTVSHANFSVRTNKPRLINAHTVEGREPFTVALASASVINWPRDFRKTSHTRLCMGVNSSFCTFTSPISPEAPSP